MMVVMLVLLVLMLVVMMVLMSVPELAAALVYGKDEMLVYG